MFEVCLFREVYVKLIITADWHIRPDTPRCRKDEDWLKTQEEQVKFVVNEAYKRSAALCIAGDLFHKSQVPDYLKNMLMKYFKEEYAIAGNHCLPFHSLENIDNSSFGVLLRAGVIKEPTFAGFAHYGQEVKEIKQGILFLHELVFENEKSCPPDVKAKTAIQVLQQYPEAKWIFTGDQHRGFHVKMQGRHLINAGCLNRQASDYIDYEPVIWCVDIETETVERIPVPDDVNMVTNEHIQEKNDRENRISAFVTQVRNSKSITLDFENNVKEAMKESDLSEGAINTVNELMEVV